MDSIIEKDILDDAELYAQQLDQNSEFKILTTGLCPKDKAVPFVTPEKMKQVNKHHDWKKEEYKGMPGHNDSVRSDENGNFIRPRYLSNHTHFSQVDPDARISTKPGKPRQLNYYAQIAVDDANHIITGACADFADKRDSECLEHITELTNDNLALNGLCLDQIIADTGYSSGDALYYCSKKNIDAFIPNFGQYKNERPGFIFNKILNHYECLQGNRAILHFKGTKTDSKGYSKNTYRSSETDCSNCPLRHQCCGKSTKFKKIEDSIHKNLYDRMHNKMNTTYARRMSKIRSKTVEPVLGHLINFLGMKHIQARGIRAAIKHALMASLCHNLKRLMKTIIKKPKITALTVNISLINAKNWLYFYFFPLRHSISLCIIASNKISPFSFKLKN